MIKYADGELLDLLPAYFSGKPEVVALSYAIKRAMEPITESASQIAPLSCLDLLSENLLDYLAVELDTIYYDGSYSIESKRAILKDAILVKMQLGTNGAIDTMSKTLLGADASIKEWFDYGGDPYYFRIKLDAPMPNTGGLDFLTLIDYVKNVRSRLEAIEFYTPEATFYVAHAIKQISSISPTNPIGMDPVALYTWLEDEDGALLTDETGNVLIYQVIGGRLGDFTLGADALGD